MGALPPFVYLVVALGSVVIAGGLLVWVVGYIRGAGRKRASSSGRQPSGSGPTSGGDQELLRVSRIGEDRLAVFVQGKRYRHLQEIKDSQVGRETVEALQAVLTFAEGWLPSLRPESPQIEAQRPAVEERVAPPRPRLSDLIVDLLGILAGMSLTVLWFSLRSCLPRRMKGKRA